MAKAKETKEEVKPKKDYTLEISVNDLNYKTKAKDLTEALTDFVNSPDYPFGVKTKLIIRYGKGDDIRQRIIPVQEARRLISVISKKTTAFEILIAKLTRE